MVSKTFADGAKQFEILLEEIYSGITETLIYKYSDKFEKFQKLMEKAIFIPINKSGISKITGLIGNDEKKALVLYLIEIKKIKL